jgi:tetratricopeptide (TPR) repeat protein
MRWGVDAIYLGHLERAQPDAARLQELLPEAGMPYWISATTYFLAGDYAQLIVYTDNLKRDNPNAFYVTMLYREMTLLDQGDFKTVLSEIDGLETEANAAASIAGRMLVDFPALAPMRALVYEMTGNTAAAQADQEQVRVSRILETLANTANTMMSNMGPPVPMLVYSSYIMEVDYARTVARLSYDYALNSAPDYYLANWRRGVLAEEAGDYQDAYTYYARASGNAPVPFPIVSYLLARLIHTHGETLESPAEACNVLARAQADAETDPEFYALLLESIRALRADVACES